ncbi:hypothetical protein, partial [Xanthomonas arboricola]|uniref:hypothetical protein n=1 Tax=Xanthomonas arboricola TaxID=56448 RepID=UPI001C850973
PTTVHNKPTTQYPSTPGFISNHWYGRWGQVTYLVFRTSRTVLGAVGIGIFIGGLCGLVAILIVSIASSGYTSLIGEMKRSGVGSWFVLHFMIAIVLGGWTVGGMIGLVVSINFKKTKSGVSF